MLLERKREDMIGMLEDAFAVTVSDGVFRQDSCSNPAMHRHGRGLDGIATVRDRCKRLVVDFHARCSVLGDRAIFGDDDRNGFADITDLVAGEDKRMIFSRKLFAESPTSSRTDCPRGVRSELKCGRRSSSV